MDMPMILVTMGVLLGVTLLAILLVMKRRDEKRDPDYRAIFIMGIAFAPMGIPLWIATRNPGMLGISALGIIYIAIGLQHKDEWKKR